ncbi:hypothetical protein GLOIN_2v1772900 [Rhizophagus clarus]|uniref:F-box domain-containing protein n=1 Tax=Rhizophagus clarus TaxID=94130 RepID=A0A8H3M765_9GLOM|nr:hypothetical protein GLOIN_2v1772900 [Rhizophagus clarus]
MASLRFFQDVTLAPRKAEDLTQEEDYWINSAYMGGLVWAEPYEGIATELDFNEFYPKILAFGGASWPVRAGEFKTITHNLNYYNLEYGIYRAFIKGQPANQKCIRGFRFNPAGYYTHYDLKLAMELDLHIELSSESPNALIYDKAYLMSGYNSFYQWASYLTNIKQEGRQAGKVAKHMLVSLWGRLYSDGRRPGPHRRMAPFITARGRRIISGEIIPLGDRVKRIHTDGFIISDKNTEQLIERYEGVGKSDLKIVKSGFVTIKNVMNLKWINFEEIVSPSLSKSGKSPIRFISLPNEILDRIFQHYRKDRDKKMYPLLFVNKQWYYIARRLVWQRISLTAISGIKFTKALSKNTKPDACAQVLGLKFIGEINIEPDVYISEVCKACPNLQWLSFENSGSRILNNKNLEALLAECPNLKRLTIRGSRRISPKAFLKIPELTPSLGTIEIRGCLRIGKNILSDFQNFNPKIKLIIESDEE